MLPSSCQGLDQRIVMIPRNRALTDYNLGSIALLKLISALRRFTYAKGLHLVGQG